MHYGKTIILKSRLISFLLLPIFIFGIFATVTDAGADTTLDFTDVLTSTTTSWVAPADVASAAIETWGGGGAGGGVTGNANANGGGGAGGAYAKKANYSLTPGNSYTVSIAGTKAGTTGAGSAGDPTWFSSNDTNGVVANGGAGGGAAASNNTNGTGATGSSSTSFGDGGSVFHGGNGAPGVSNSRGGPGGGGAGSTGNGGDASTSANTAGTGTSQNGGNGGTGGGNNAAGGNASTSGAGGGGGGARNGSNNATDRNGGTGAAGLLKISYSITDPSAGVTFVGAGAHASGTASSQSPEIPTGVQEGDFLILFITGKPSGTAGSNDAINVPVGWTQRGPRVRNELGTNDLSIEMWYKFAGSSESAPTITAGTAFNGTEGWTTQIAAYRGVDPSSPWDLVSSSAGTNADATTFIPPAVTTNTTRARVISAVATEDDNTLGITSPFAGFTARMSGSNYNETAGTDHSFGMADRPVITAGSTAIANWQQTANGADSWVYITDALKPASVLLGDGTDGSDSTIAPGTNATEIDRFSLMTLSGTDTVTDMTVTLAPANAYNNIASVSVQTTGGTVKCLATGLSSNTVNLTSCGISVSTSETEYKVTITPKTHANMPAVPGASYATTATVTSITTTGTNGGFDADSATITVDNASPNSATSTSGTVGDTKVTINWTTASGETTDSVLLRWAASSPGSDVPVEGATYTAGNTIGSAAVACVITSQTSASVLSKTDGTGGSSGCNTSALSNGTAYSYKIFQKDANGNYDAGTTVSGGPFTPQPPISISGTCKQKDFSTNCTDTGTLKFAVNGSLQAQTQATVAGTWSITGITAPAAGSVITVFIDGAADANEAVGITKYDGSGDISIALIETFVVLGSDDTGITLSNTDLGQYDGDDDEDLPFTSNSGSLSGGTTSLALVAGTYSPGGSVTINTFLQTGGTVNGGSASWTITEGSGGLSLYLAGGIFTATSGTTTISGYNSIISISGSVTFNHGGGTFYLGTGDYVSIDPNGAQFNNVVIDKGGCCGYVAVSGTWRIAGDLTVNNLGSGSFFDGGSGSIELSGNFSTSSTHSTGALLLKFVGTGSQTVNGNGVEDAGLPAVEVAKPSGTLSFTGEEFEIQAYNNGWKYTSGTVDMGDSAILFTGGHLVIDAAGMNFNNVLINETDCCGETTLNSSLTVAGSLEVTSAGASGFIGGQTVYVGGDLEVDNADDCLPPRGGCEDARGVNFVLNGTGAQTLTDVSGTMPTGSITINKSSGTVTIDSDLTTYGNLVITSGTFDQSTDSDLTVNGTVTVSSGGIWNNTGTGGVTLGGNVSNSGIINLDAHGNGCGDTDDIVLTSTDTTKRTWSGSGTFSLSDLTVSYMQGTITVSSSTNGGNNTNWTFGGCGVTISGTVYSDAGSTAITSGPTVRIKINGAGSYSATANGSGVYSISSIPVSFGNVVTVYLDGATPKAVTVTHAGSGTSDISGLNLWQDYLIVRHEDSVPMTNTNLGTYDKDDDSDIFFTANSGTLTVDSGKTLYIASGDTFSPGGSVSADKLSISGTYDNATSNPNLTLTGDLTIANGGTFTKGSGTLTLSGGSSQSVTDSNSTKQDLGTISVGGGGATSASWCNISTYCTSSWTYRRQVIFHNSNSSTNLTNFPVLIHLASSSFNFSNTKSAGADIRFVDADGTSSLSYEIESWAPTGKGAYIWVKIPQLDHTDSDYVWMYYGNAGASDAQSSANVWDSNYKGVWHFNQTPASAQLDSTANSNSGTSTNLESGDQVAAQIGGGLQLDGTNEKITVADSSSLDVTDYTAEAVVSLTSLTHNTFIFERGSSDLSQDNFYLWYNGGTWIYGFRDASDFYDHTYSEDLVPTVERHMAVVLDTAADTISLYINGVQVDSEAETHTPVTTGTQVLSWGLSTESGASNVGVVGVMDEGRISNVVRSSDWINAEYRSSMGLMTTVGGEETSSTTPDAWCDISTDCTSDWTLRQKVYFNNSASSTNLTNFPVLVHFASDSFDFSKVNSDGGDIRFVDSDSTTLLPYEIDTWAPTGKGAYIWVKIPQLDHTDSDYVWMYYGNAGATNPDLNSVGAGEARTGTSATGTGWTNPTNVLNQQTDQFATYAASGQAPLIITGFGYSIPSDATITGFMIQVYGFGGSGTASNRSVQFGLTKDGSSLAGSYASSVNLAATGSGFDDEFVSAGNSTSLFGTTWTPADINSNNFGIMIRAGNTNTSSRNIILAGVQISFTTPYGADQVWDSNYKGVWHFNPETLGGQELFYNSTAAPQNNGSFTPDGDWSPATGIVSNAVDTEGLFAPGENYTSPGAFTISGWFKTSSLDNIDQVTLYGSGTYPDSGFDIIDQGPYHNYLLLRVYPSSVTTENGGNSCDTPTHTGEACIPRAMVNDGRWHWLIAIYDGSNIGVILDNNPIDFQSAGTYVQGTDSYVYLGSGTHPIAYDEFRFSTTDRSDDWLLAEYRTMTSGMATLAPSTGTLTSSVVNASSPIKASSLTIPANQRLNLGTNTLTLTGDLTNDGVLDGSSGNIVIEPTASTITLGGTASISFNNFTIASGAGKTIKIKASKQVAINGNFTLSGSPTAPLNLSSDTPGSKWNINFHGTPNFSFVNIKDAGCVGASGDIILNEKASSLGNNDACWKFFGRGAGGSGSSAPAEGGAGGSGSQGGGGIGGGGSGSDGGGAGGSGSQGGGGSGGGGSASP